jgi:hypothetical protein
MPKLIKPTRTTERVPAQLRITSGDGGGIQLSAAQPIEGDRPPLRRFTMTAYTGNVMQLAGWRYPVVVDLAGLRISKKSRPILKDHNTAQIVGHTDDIRVTDTALEVAGVISGAGASAQEVIATSENGFPWQASLGATAEKVVFIGEGRTASANGREFAGPLYIARKSVLGEVSFVALGADDETSAHVAASANSTHALEVMTMEFEQWAADNNFVIEGLDEKNLAGLKAMYEKQQLAAAAPQPEPVVVPEPVVEPPVESQLDLVQQQRVDVAKEIRRISAIKQICNGRHPEIEATAIEQNWDEAKTELAVLRADRPTAPAIVTSKPDVSFPAVLEAALCMAGKLAGLEKTFSDQVLQTAKDRFRGRIGLQELLLEAAWVNGYAGRSFRSDMHGVLQAAFSTFSLPGILSNTANKFLLQAFTAVEANWRAISAVRPVSDFKQVTSHRLVADLMYDEVGPDGELKHGKVSEESFTNQAKTYGKMFSITRTDLINDDLGALTAVPSQLGRGAALKLNDVFWRTFMDNASFFSVANKNYAAGTDTALNIDGLTKAEQMFLDQTGPDGYPLAIVPEILLVPNALYAVAQQLMNATEIREDGNTTAKKYPTNNPHAGKFRVQRTSYLSNTLISGNSTKAWYLLADPANLPTMEVAFLNGVESPMVESAEADFRNLGVQFRGVFDYGVARFDFRGGAKLKGEA